MAKAAQRNNDPPLNGHQITFSKNQTPTNANDFEVMSSTLQPNKKNIFADASASDGEPIEEDSINLRQQPQYPSSSDTPSLNSKASTKVAVRTKTPSQQQAPEKISFAPHSVPEAIKRSSTKKKQ